MPFGCILNIPSPFFGQFFKFRDLYNNYLAIGNQPKNPLMKKPILLVPGAAAYALPAAT